MSMLSQSTIWGKIIYQGENYDILNQPLNKKNLKKIEFYRKEMSYSSISKASGSVGYLWDIIDNKLYLKDIGFINSFELDKVKYTIDLKEQKERFKYDKSILNKLDKEYKFKIKLMKRIQKIKEKKFKPLEIIFKKDKLRAKWFDGEIRLLISTKLLQIRKKRSRLCQREVLVLNFEKGVLKNTDKRIEEYTESNLKDYI
jgi:hypothetical protein